jgi:hypothetical protein
LSETQTAVAWPQSHLSLVATPRPGGFDELMERIREAITLCLEVHGESPELLDFIGVQRVRVSA